VVGKGETTSFLFCFRDSLTIPKSRFSGAEKYLTEPILDFRFWIRRGINRFSPKRMFEKSWNVDFTTPATEKRLGENKGFGVCDRTHELHLRLKLTLFKHPLTTGFLLHYLLLFFANLKSKI